MLGNYKYQLCPAILIEGHYYYDLLYIMINAKSEKNIVLLPTYHTS